MAPEEEQFVLAYKRVDFGAWRQHFHVALETNIHTSVPKEQIPGLQNMFAITQNLFNTTHPVISFHCGENTHTIKMHVNDS